MSPREDQYAFEIGRDARELEMNISDQISNQLPA